MKKAFWIGLCLVACLMGGRTAHADYQTGLDAYNQGNFKEADRAWRPLAEAGDPKAQHGLGLLYETGKGVTMDMKEAARWYELAAAQHFAAAENNLALLYAQGAGVPKDDVKAMEFWSRAALGGNASAQFNLGNRYAQGLGIPMDENKALQFWQQAAEGGNAEARYNLGLYYYRKNDSEALQKAAKEFSLAADQGLPEAFYAMGEMARLGKGRAVDKKQAGQYYAQAASKGIKDAEQRITELTQEGVQWESAILPKSAETKDSSQVQPAVQQEKIAEIPSPENAHAEPAKASTISEPVHARESSAGSKGDPSIPENEVIKETASLKPEELRDGIAHVIEIPQPIYRIWLAEKESEENAKTEWLKLSSHYAILLKDIGAQFRRFDLGEKGVVFRIFAGKFTRRAEADRLCEALNARDQEIFCRSVLN